MAKKEDKIFIQVGDEVTELVGEIKENFIADAKATIENFNLLEENLLKQKKARENAIKKLAEIAGLTDEEIEAII